MYVRFGADAFLPFSYEMNTGFPTKAPAPSQVPPSTAQPSSAIATESPTDVPTEARTFWLCSACIYTMCITSDSFLSGSNLFLAVTSTSFPTITGKIETVSSARNCVLKVAVVELLSHIFSCAYLIDFTTQVSTSLKFPTHESNVFCADSDLD
jgi:hypothetical protein